MPVERPSFFAARLYPLASATAWRTTLILNSCILAREEAPVQGSSPRLLRLDEIPEVLGNFCGRYSSVRENDAPLNDFPNPNVARPILRMPFHALAAPFGALLKHGRKSVGMS